MLSVHIDFPLPRGISDDGTCNRPPLLPPPPPRPKPKLPWSFLALGPSLLTCGVVEEKDEASRSRTRDARKDAMLAAGEAAMKRDKIGLRVGPQAATIPTWTSTRFHMERPVRITTVTQELEILTSASVDEAKSSSMEGKKLTDRVFGVNTHARRNIDVAFSNRRTDRSIETIYKQVLNESH